MRNPWPTASAATVTMLLAASVAMAQDAVPQAEAVEFTAHFPWGPIIDEGTPTERPDGITELVGFTARTSARESSDPRFDGNLLYGCSELAYPADQGTLYFDCVHRIETAAGAWQVRPTEVGIEFPGADIGPFSVVTWVFDGEAGYEGLTAIVEVTEVPFDGFSMHGIIIDAGAAPKTQAADA